MQRLTPLVLIVDDDAALSGVLERLVRSQGCEAMVFPDGGPALAALPSLRPDVALVDVQMPNVGGLDVLRAIREVAPDCRVVLMTGQPNVETAVEAVKLGALDYLSKPFDFDRVRELLATVGHGIEQQQDVFAAETKLAARVEFCGMIGRSAVMQDLFDTIRRLAPHVRAALIIGETGTGKELVARALHHVGPRRTRRFIPFNCSAIVETLFESEFFGHTRGAFTGATEAKAGLFEQAHGGTLFLDEIGEMPLSMQAKLLRVVEYGEVQRVGAVNSSRVDVQILAATNRVVAEEVAAGRFREDLYYRLSVAEIHVPPLRERRHDVCLLVAAFVKQFGKQFRKPLVGLTPAAERLLEQAPWPGNVRELRNTLERACMLSDGRLLGEREIAAALRRVPLAASPRPRPSTSEGDEAPQAERPDITREAVEQALKDVEGNRTAAARRLGLTRRSLYRRLDTFGLR